jgi:hypothetical protein
VELLPISNSLLGTKACTGTSVYGKKCKYKRDKWKKIQGKISGTVYMLVNFTAISIICDSSNISFFVVWIPQ